jgi:hypothetical protein
MWPEMRPGRWLRRRNACRKRPVANAAGNPRWQRVSVPPAGRSNDPSGWPGVDRASAVLAKPVEFGRPDPGRHGQSGAAMLQCGSDGKTVVSTAFRLRGVFAPLVGALVFKTSGGFEQSSQWVRFPYTPAHDPSSRWRLGRDRCTGQCGERRSLEGWLSPAECLSFENLGDDLAHHRG